MMIEYHKIQTGYVRDPDNAYKICLKGDLQSLNVNISKTQPGYLLRRLMGRILGANEMASRWNLNIMISCDE